MNSKSNFVCQQCGYSQIGWAGKCPNCGEWGSLVETLLVTSKRKAKASKAKGEIIKPVNLASVSSKKTLRISTKIRELDRVLGGGLVAGQVVLIAGEPGIGKSTILLQLADKLGNVLYISGEESINQIKIRADRLGVGKKSSKNKKMVQLLEETDVDAVLNTISNLKGSTFKAVVVDSIQTMQTTDLSGMAGSVGQVKECAHRLVRLAKSKNIPVFIAGHVTKQGSIAGPSILMHIVDTVLWFEGDKSSTLRILRARKNRFGPTDEVGVFSMEDKGLISMDDPEKIFLSTLGKNVAGSAVASILQGTRPMLVEIQSLVVPSKLAFPRRVAQGIDSKKLELLIAVLTRRCGIPLYEYDVFTNVAGGMSIKNDPSSDLAITLSIASAFYDKSLPKSTIAVGEVGLLGDVREVVAQEKRIKEARRMGYRNVISSVQLKYLQQAMREYLK